MVTPAAKRQAVEHLRVAHGMSERRACVVVGADRKSMRYRSTRADDGEVRSRLRDIAQQRRRFGYRRLHILLRREGVVINRKKTQRLYTEEGLTVRKRRSRRRAVGARAAPPVVALPNQRWSLDFVHDQLASGRRFRVLNVVDDVTRECLLAVADTSISGKRVVRELADLIAWRGKPRMIVSDNGTELTSNAVLSWCGEAKIEWHYIAPGKPTQNGYVESFNGCGWMKTGGSGQTLDIKDFRTGRNPPETLALNGRTSPSSRAANATQRDGSQPNSARGFRGLVMSGYQGEKFAGLIGGEGGIRTHGTREGTTVFETVPIDHSGTSPRAAHPGVRGRRPAI